MPRDSVVIEAVELEQSPNTSPDFGFQPSQLYESLPLTTSSCIRVLDIVRDKQNSTGPLRGTLRVVNLRDSPRFTALSYVWGEFSPIRDVVWCNAAALPVTKSCYEALSSLREIYGTFTIWIDAICINQGNEGEKSSQIPLMHEIYTWAEAVYIWLGRGTSEATRAIEFLSRNTQYLPSTPGIPWITRKRHASLSRDRILFYFRCLPLMINSMGGRLRCLISYPWLERILSLLAIKIIFTDLIYN